MRLITVPKHYWTDSLDKSECSFSLKINNDVIYYTIIEYNTEISRKVIHLFIGVDSIMRSLKISMINDLLLKNIVKL